MKTLLVANCDPTRLAGINDARERRTYFQLRFEVALLRSRRIGFPANFFIDNCWLDEALPVIESHLMTREANVVAFGLSPNDDFAEILASRAPDFRLSSVAGSPTIAELRSSGYLSTLQRRLQRKQERLLSLGILECVPAPVDVQQRYRTLVLDRLRSEAYDHSDCAATSELLFRLEEASITSLSRSRCYDELSSVNFSGPDRNRIRTSIFDAAYARQFVPDESQIVLQQDQGWLPNTRFSAAIAQRGTSFMLSVASSEAAASFVADLAPIVMEATGVKDSFGVEYADVLVDAIIEGSKQLTPAASLLSALPAIALRWTTWRATTATALNDEWNSFDLPNKGKREGIH